MAFDHAIGSIPGSQRTIFCFGEHLIIHATAEETAGAVGIWEMFPAAGWGPDFHTHTRETEVFMVLEGRFRFYCGDDVYEGGAGAVFTMPPHIPHRWENISTSKGRIMFLVSPGGFEGFFIDIAGIVEPTGADIDAIGKQYGLI